MNLASTLAAAHGRPWLARLDPRLKLAWLAAVSVLSVVLDSTFALAALFLLAAVLASGLKMRLKGWLAIIGLLAAIAWGTLLSQALFYQYLPRTVLWTIIPPGEIWSWSFPGLRLYREGMVYGLAQSLRMLAMTLSGLTVCLSTSPERLLAALVRLRVPAAIGFMTVSALRFLPVMLSELATVRQARRLRGYRGFTGKNLRQAAAMETALLLPVLASAMRRATTLATSVAARGFDPSARRTVYPEFQMPRQQRLALAALTLAVLLILTAKTLYWLYLGDLYYEPNLRSLYHFAREWL